MRNTKIIGATMLVLACGVFSTPNSFATSTPAGTDPSATSNGVSQNNANMTDATAFNDLQDLLAETYLIPDYAANPELYNLVQTAESFSENSDPDQIMAVIGQLSSLLATEQPAPSSYDSADATSGDSSVGGGDPADKFEDNNEPSNPNSGSTPTLSPSDQPRPSNSSDASNTPSGASGNRRSSVPNTGVADQSTATSAIASSTIFAGAAVFAILAFATRRHYLAKKHNQ